MNKTIIISGPTASGKTIFAINLSKHLKTKGVNSVIINADSRQVYKGMDIGTNKGILKLNNNDIESNINKYKGYDLDNSGITGYLFNILSPSDDFSLSLFQRYALDIINILYRQNILPIIVGGTGLYIDSIVKGYRLIEVKPDKHLRDELNKLNTNELLIKLEGINKKISESLNNSDRNNPHRLIRLIEKSISNNVSYNNHNDFNIDTKIYYPIFNKEELFKTIELRVKDMINNGFIDEVKSLIEQGFKSEIVLKGIGYDDVVKYLDGIINIEDCINNIIIKHKNYAKRQITWFEGRGRNYNLFKLNYNNDYTKIVI